MIVVAAPEIGLSVPLGVEKFSISIILDRLEVPAIGPSSTSLSIAANAGNQNNQANRKG